ncbi:MAG: hypothetical protein KJ063_02145 [Anaerolineae bacterium]|nr:hypothetical protein [Anaerolineae bacterium]
MNELASMNLFQPRLVGSAPVEYGGDITWACWPSYKRTTRALGGDFQASFQFSADDGILERWFNHYLACHFEESFGGGVTFSGLIWTMRLAYNGFVLVRSLDNVYNSVQVRYQSSSASSPATTTAGVDGGSGAHFGTRQLLEVLSGVYVPEETAEVYRDNLLSRLAWPKANKDALNLAGDRQPGTLQVEVRGYIHTLNGKLYSEKTTSEAAASGVIAAIIEMSDFVTAGQIEENELTISEEGDDRPAWDVIQKIVALGSAGGSRWLAGCFQGQAFSYKRVDVDAILYEQELKTKRQLTYDGLTNNLVPFASIQPGGVLFVRDIMPGLPGADPLLDDPRAIFVEEVEYSAAGASLKGSPATEANKAAALAIAMRQRPKKGPRGIGLAAQAIMP